MSQKRKCDFMDHQYRYCCSPTLMQYVEHTTAFHTLPLGGRFDYEYSLENEIMVGCLVHLHNMQNFSIFDLQTALEKFLASQLLSDPLSWKIKHLLSYIDTLSLSPEILVSILMDIGYISIFGTENPKRLQPFHWTYYCHFENLGGEQLIQYRTSSPHPCDCIHFMKGEECKMKD